MKISKGAAKPPFSFLPIELIAFYDYDAAMSSNFRHEIKS